MKENRLKLAKEWFVKGDHDLTSAELLYKNHGYTDIIAVLIQQAIEKYLKGCLISQGWKLRRIHDLVELLKEAIRMDKSFNKFLPVCEKITKYYYDTRYPYSAVEYSRGEIKQSLKEARQIINKIKEAIE